MGDFITRNLKKKVTRANEKLLQNLGKADKTTDDEFEDHCSNFNKQQKSADRLQKEVKAYVASIRAMSAASRGFYEALREIYEPEWPAVEHVKALSQSLEIMWEEYHEQLQDQALNPLNSYASQFGDLEKKINKRGRKLVDYDGARHNLDTLTKQQNKKPDDPKVMNAQRDLCDKKKLYEDLNVQLSDELPALYDSRITFYVNQFQTIFNLEHTFHNETATMTRDLCNRMDDLGHALGRLRVPRRQSLDVAPVDTQSKVSPQRPPQPSPNPPKTVTHDESPAKENGQPATAGNSVEKQEPVAKKDSNGKIVTPVYPNLNSATDKVEDSGKSEKDDKENTEASNADSVHEKETTPDMTPEAMKRTESKSKGVVKTEDDLFPPEEEGPGDETPTNREATSYKVRATHRYTAEDVDELSFESGELIKVVPFEDPDDQDEGWLMGVRESDGAKGVFPANFTKPI